MTLNIYSIFDTVAQVFNKPFTELNNATAIRAFTGSIQSQEYKDDYVLYNLGELDDNSGVIKPNENPVKILSGLEVERKVDNQMEQVPETPIQKVG